MNELAMSWNAAGTVSPCADRAITSRTTLTTMFATIATMTIRVRVSRKRFRFSTVWSSLR